MQTSDLVKLVMDDYEMTGKRSSPSVVCHSKNLIRLLPRIPDSPRIVEEYKHARIKEGAAPSTVNNELTVLRRGFRIAKLREMILAAPIIESLPVENTRTVTCTRAQAEKLISALDVLDHAVADLVRWLLCTGWRRGEAQNLVWQDFLDDRTAVQLPQKKNKNKTVRYIKISETVRELVERRWVLKDGDYVFQRNGKRISTFRGVWRRAVAAAGCPGLWPHDLRRVFAQLSIDAGVDPIIFAQIAGWKTLSIIKRYTIANGRMQAIAQEKVAKQFQISRI